jgi:hypothetical protein
LCPSNVVRLQARVKKEAAQLSHHISTKPTIAVSAKASATAAVEEVEAAVPLTQDVLDQVSETLTAKEWAAGPVQSAAQWVQWAEEERQGGVDADGWMHVGDRALTDVEWEGGGEDGDAMPLKKKWFSRLRWQ